METLVLSTAAAFVSDIGHGTSYKMAGQTLLLLESVIDSNVSHPDIQQKLMEMDLNASLSTVRAMISDFEPAFKKCGSAMSVCFTNLRDCIKEIQDTLTVVEKKCREHKASYYSYLYSHPNLNQEMERISRLKQVMDYRIDLTTKTAEIELQISKFHKQTKYQYKEESKIEIIQEMEDGKALNDCGEYIFVEKTIKATEL